MDKLEHIFQLQEAFDSELSRRRNIDFTDSSVWVQREMIALLVEMGELLSEVNYKWWKDPKPVDRARVLEEMVDMLHFYVAACLRMGFSAEDIYKAYLEKNQENFMRQRGQSTREGYKSGLT